MLDVPLDYEPVPAAHGLAVLRVEALAAVREYVRRRLPFSGLYDAFLTSRMFRDFAEAAPGFEELMCLGKLYDLAESSRYAHVVFDAPATGHMKTLIDVPAATLEAIQVGPLNHNARRIQDLLLDPDRCRVILVTLPEEMAVSEALELRAFCAERRMGLGPIVVNQFVKDHFDPAELSGMERIQNPSPALRGAVDCVREEIALSESHASAVARLRDLGPLLVPRFVDHTPAALLRGIDASLGQLA